MVCHFNLSKEPVVSFIYLFYCLFSCCFFFLSFIYFVRDSMSRGGADRVGERENPKQALHCWHRTRHRSRTHKTVRSWPGQKPRVRNSNDWAIQAPPAHLFSFYFIYSYSDLRYILPSTNFGFCSFSSSLRCQVQTFIWNISCFLI